MLIFIGALGAAFYAEVLFFPSSLNSHNLSQLRSLIQALAWLFFAVGVGSKRCL